MFRITSRAFRGAVFATFAFAPAVTSAQSGSAADSLVRHALAANPRIRAAALQLDASRARIGPAGAWADPMLMAGIQNLPISKQSVAHGTAAPEPMTMKMLGLSQTVPYPGKTSLRARMARAEAEVAGAQLAIVTRDVTREVVDAFIDLTTARMVLITLERQQQIAASILPATEARYVAGTAAQADVLKARTEATMLVQERNAAAEQEHSALARLAALTNGAEASVIAPDSSGVTRIKEVTELDRLQALAAQTNPRLRERRAMVAIQSAQADLARKEYLPDVDVSLQYGQRDRLPDMITAMVSLPVPVHRGRKQTATARAARLDAASAEAELRAEENAVRSEVARAHAAVQRQRANVELLEQGILPQARATFTSATATYQSGRGELLNVLDARRALFATEIMYARTLADYAKALNELAALAGEEVLP
jgi:cobalt-zinc-cadmium efflux system outer membrane protein